MRLAIARARQENKEGYAPRIRAMAEATKNRSQADTNRSLAAE